MPLNPGTENHIRELSSLEERSNLSNSLRVLTRLRKQVEIILEIADMGSSKTEEDRNAYALYRWLPDIIAQKIALRREKQKNSLIVREFQKRKFTFED